MKARETLVLISAMIVLAVAGLFVFGSSDVQAAIPELEDVASTPLLAEEAMPLAEIQSVSLDEEEKQAMQRAERIGGPAPTSGTVKGGIVLTTDAVGVVGSYTIIVHEEINENTSDKTPITIQKTFKMPERFSPQFQIDNIPFSAYGYRVSVFAQGFNGSSRVININKTVPYAIDIDLAITPGSPFCIRLHDQHHNPSVDRRIRLIPIGTPVGRTALDGTSDSFGSLTFNSVLQGDYKVLVEDNEIETVQILATRGTGNVNIQYRTILIPDGIPVRIEVLDSNSWGVPEAKLTLYRIDTIQNIRIDGVTNEAGIYEFPYVSPGRYQLDASAEGFGRKSLQIKIVKESKDPVTKILKMPRL